MSTERWYSEWITEAPDNFTVGQAEQAEQNDMPWPISGDETTIAQRIDKPGATK